MEPVVPLFVVAPERTNTLKPMTKETARMMPRSWIKESLRNTGMLLSITASLVH
jgi:hypothetical protein